jgi:formate dehydrogenase maturation protein FdhE
VNRFPEVPGKDFWIWAHLRRETAKPIIPSMAKDSWQRRVERAQDLANRHAFAAEILGFYVQIACFQEKLYQQLDRSSNRRIPVWQPGAPPGLELEEFKDNFESFLKLVEAKGPMRLAESAREVHADSPVSWGKLLDRCWSAAESGEPETQAFLGRAFLQPYAELVRSRSTSRWDGYGQAVCPFCHRKPGLGVLRQQGDGSRRSLMCSFCLAEWEFRRIVCPGCGEQNNAKLPVYTAEGFDYLRIECCDTCRRYLKGVDLTKNGLAEPVVDEIASIPLDLWAQERGYAKLERNLFGM